MKNEKLYKALCQLLPHGVMMYWEDFKGIPKEAWKLCPETLQDAIIRKNKPYLRPISYLTKEIKHDREVFVFTEYIEDKYAGLNLDRQLKRIIENNNWINQSSHLLVLELIEKKFDIHGLIESGDAIAVTKDNNPYK